MAGCKADEAIARYVKFNKTFQSVVEKSADGEPMNMVGLLG